MTENKRQRPAPPIPASRGIGAAIASLAQAATAAPCYLIAEVDRFHTVRENTLAALAEVSTEQALWSPREGVWSISQIADHLLRSEDLYREQFYRLIRMAKEGRNTPVQISLREIDSSFAGIPRDVMQFFELPARMLNLFVPHAVREMIIRYPLVSALNPTASEPRPGRPIGEISADMAASLTQTENLLRAPLPSNVEGPSIDHPIMGRNNIPQLLRIVIAHEERHQGQIADLRAHADFPNAGWTS